MGCRRHQFDLPQCGECRTSSREALAAMLAQIRRDTSSSVGTVDPRLAELNATIARLVRQIQRGDARRGPTFAEALAIAITTAVGLFITGLGVSALLWLATPVRQGFQWVLPLIGLPGTWAGMIWAVATLSVLVGVRLAIGNHVAERRALLLDQLTWSLERQELITCLLGAIQQRERLGADSSQVP